MASFPCVRVCVRAREKQCVLSAVVYYPNISPRSFVCLNDLLFMLGCSCDVCCYFVVYLLLLMMMFVFVGGGVRCVLVCLRTFICHYLT